MTCREAFAARKFLCYLQNVQHTEYSNLRYFFFLLAFYYLLYLFCWFVRGSRKGELSISFVLTLPILLNRNSFARLKWMMITIEINVNFAKNGKNQTELRFATSIDL